MTAALSLSAPAQAQSLGGQNLGDPKRCAAIVDEMGDVGFRISDSQLLADAVITAFRKRLGFDAVHYAGVAASAAAMKKLLATPEGAAPQEAQLAWFKQCEESAGWRLRARFGVAKKAAPEKRHWVTLACRKKGAEPAAPVEEKRFEAKTFLEARDAAAAALPSFCTAMAPAAPTAGSAAPGTSGTPGTPATARPKDEKPWVPPPRRE